MIMRAGEPIKNYLIARDEVNKFKAEERFNSRRLKWAEEAGKAAQERKDEEANEIRDCIKAFLDGDNSQLDTLLAMLQPPEEGET